jgi:tRNA-2-methylthio-N6-dimethylallyladenosine synthase
MVRESPVSAFVTVMEGCNNFCSYCVVPFARGREKFRPLGNILEEIRDLAQRGYKEVQLLGQNVNSYRDPQSGLRFAFLLKKAGLVAGLEWIRFITSHPKNFDEEIALAMAETKNVCHQLHLPLQSGSSTVLARMNRGYSQEDYLTKVDLLRRLMPDIALSTDIIVGFPGESEKEFEETLAVLDQVRFTNIFSFRYCPRPQTAASQMADDVPPEEKQRRLQEVQELQKKIQVENNRRLLGKTFKILGTGKSKKDKGVYTGRNEAAQVVNFTSSTDPTGCFVQVLITGCGPYSLRGEGSG